MKKLLICLFISLLLFETAISAQDIVNKYEVEILANPTTGKKDTREVNAVLIFEKDNLIIKSRRKNEIFKEMKYDEIKSVEHSFSKRPLIKTESKVATAIVAYISPMLLIPIEKHWLTIQTEEDFAVLKIENDNYRMIKAELEIRKVKLTNVSED